MRTKFTLILFSLITCFITNSYSQAYQIPNGGFETWDSVNGAPLYPVGWSSYESIYELSLGLSSQDAGAFGNYSIKVSSDTGAYYTGVLAGVVSLGTGATVNNYPTFYGEPFAYRPDTFFFAFKYSTPGIDTPYVNVLMTNQDTSVVLTMVIPLPDSANWTLTNFDMDVNYLNGKTPDTLALQFYSSYNAPVIGSALNIDGVYFGYVTLPTAIQEVVDKLNLSIYPNPTSNVLNISAVQDISGYKMLVTDMNGRLVDIVTLTGTKSSIDVHTFASGTYVYRIADAQGNIFRQDKFIVVR